LGSVFGYLRYVNLAKIRVIASVVGQLGRFATVTRLVGDRTGDRVGLLTKNSHSPPEALLRTPRVPRH
jgi:hypothetical protein